MDKKLLSVSECAVAMGIGRSLLYRMVMQGEIRSLKIGKARRIPVDAIDEFIARQRELGESDVDVSSELGLR